MTERSSGAGGAERQSAVSFFGRPSDVGNATTKEPLTSRISRTFSRGISAVAPLGGIESRMKRLSIHVSDPPPAEFSGWFLKKSRGGRNIAA